MTNIKSIPRTTRNRNRQRATRFLGTLSSDARLFRLLQDEVGYSAAAHKKGWELLLATTAAAQPEQRDSKDRQKEAIAQLDAWDGPTFSRVRAALADRFPAHLEFLLGELNQGRGAASVHTVSHFLKRVQRLRETEGTSPVAESSRTQDEEVLALLEERKIIGSEVEAQLQTWIATATDAHATAPVEDAAAEKDAAQDEAALALHQWLNDWRGQARVVLTRREDHVRLGLSKRRPSNASAESTEASAIEQSTTDTATAEATKAS